MKGFAAFRRGEGIMEISVYHSGTYGIDTDALRALGCDYILSALPIENAEALGLRDCGSFTNENSFWKIRAYGL